MGEDTQDLVGPNNSLDMIDAGNLYLSMANTVSIGVAIINLSMEIISVNLKIKAQYPEVDFSQKNTCYKSLLSLSKGEICPDCPTHLAFKDGKDHEAILNAPINNQTRRIAVKSTPVRNTDGEIVAAIEIFEDIDDSLEDAYLLLNHAVNLALLLDSEGKILVINSAAQKYLGQAQNDLVDQKIEKYLAPLIVSRLCTAGESAIETGLTQHEIIFDGPRIFDVILRPITKPDEKTTHLAVYARDITENRQAELALQQANQKLQTWIKELEQRNHESTLLNEMGDLLTACFATGEAYQVASQFMALLFNEETGVIYIYNAETQYLEAVAAWGQPLGEDEINFSQNDCWALRRGQSHFVKDSRSGLNCRHITNPQPLTSMCIPLMAQGEALGILHLRGFLDQPNGNLLGISESKQRLGVTVAEHLALALSNIRLRDSLRQQAIRDPLTGLYNRRYLEETLEREIRQAQRESIPIGVIMFDIDRLKEYNDTYGHALGDYLLQELGRRVQAKFRGEDIACRYGGDEFVVILPGANAKNAFTRAEQLRQIIKGVTLEYNGQEPPSPSLSAGIAVYPEQGATADSLLRIADKALYQAKQQGRDRVIIDLELN